MNVLFQSSKLAPAREIAKLFFPGALFVLTYAQRVQHGDLGIPYTEVRFDFSKKKEKRKRKGKKVLKKNKKI